MKELLDITCKKYLDKLQPLKLGSLQIEKSILSLMWVEVLYKRKS